MKLLTQSYLSFLIVFLLSFSCAEPSSTSDGFIPGINPTSSIEGLWNSVNYDFSQQNLNTQQVDSVFSFTGAILIEDYKANGELHRKFLGFDEVLNYTRVNSKITMVHDGDTVEAKIITLSPTHFAYTIERNLVINDTARFQFTSAQFTR